MPGERVHAGWNRHHCFLLSAHGPELQPAPSPGSLRSPRQEAPIQALASGKERSDATDRQPLRFPIPTVGRRIPSTVQPPAPAWLHIYFPCSHHNLGAQKRILGTIWCHFSIICTGRFANTRRALSHSHGWPHARQLLCRLSRAGETPAQELPRLHPAAPNSRVHAYPTEGAQTFYL